MINSIIVDDEQHSIDRLTNLLKETGPEIKLTGAFKSLEEGVKAIKDLKPELVFLDVQLRDRTGFDLLQQVEEVNFEVIFTTAYEKYAVKAFKFSAIDYLLKPVDRNELRQALDKLKNKLSNNELSAKLDTLFYNLKNSQGISRKINVPTMQGLVFLEVSEIIRCESAINYTNIFLKDGQKIIVAKSLKEFEELLTDLNFYRVHNSHLVNLSYVKSYTKGKGGSISLADGTEIDVSSRRKEQFLQRLTRM